MTHKELEQLEQEYAKRSGVTVEWLHEHGQYGAICECEEKSCKGFQMTTDINTIILTRERALLDQVKQEIEKLKKEPHKLKESSALKEGESMTMDLNDWFKLHQDLGRNAALDDILAVIETLKKEKA